ncbi:MAG: SlyX family protein [Pseudomonadales bacterium]|nr:SlyX family protein [Pseudomonadales bacterium]MCP5171857.1 SlyX family protein [Pseudomonadales bacterium]
MSESRLIELETRQVYQEDLLDDLNKIVAAQQMQIDELSEACKILIDRFNELAEGGLSDGGVASDSPPPHY